MEFGSLSNIFRVILDKLVNQIALAVNGDMMNLFLFNITYPNIVFVLCCLENVHRSIWLAEECQHGSVGPVSYINCAIFSRLTTFQRLGPFKGVYMIFKDSHDLELVEEGNPMEESIQKPFRIFIELFANTINRHMIVHKLNLLLVSLECLPHKLFLKSIKTMNIPCIENSVTDLSPFEMQKASSLFNRRHSINYCSCFVSIKLLREVFEESSAIESNVNT